MNIWVNKPKTNHELALPLLNAINVSSNPRIKKSCDAMKGFLYASNNDLQYADKKPVLLLQFIQEVMGRFLHYF